MAQYIDKDALVAEIKRLLDKYTSVHTFNYGATKDLNHLLSFIDALKVEEPDLEKHLKEDIDDVLFDLNGVAVKGATHYLTVEDVKDIAKHFYSLGIKARKE